LNVRARAEDEVDALLCGDFRALSEESPCRGRQMSGARDV